MPENDVWQNIDTDLRQLLNDSSAIPLYPAVERLHQLSSAKALPPDECRAWINVFRRMIVEFQSGMPIGTVVQKAGVETIVQPNMQVGTLNQAQGAIYQFIFQDMRSQMSEIDPGILVPIVLLVMNSDEAQALHSSEALRGYSDEVHEDFEDLRTLLIKNNLVNWVQNYGANAENWRPFKDNSETIEQLIRRILSTVTGYNKTLVPQFYKISTLNEERELLKQLRTFGCVVIMDTISMHHPMIQRDFRRSLLDAYPNTLIARIAPVSDMFTFVQRMILFTEKNIDLEFYKRLALDDDMKCAEVSRELDFRRWLKDKVPAILPEEEKAKEGVHAYFHHSKV